MVGWLVARWFLGGEMVGGEIPWWRDDRIPLSSGHWSLLRQLHWTWLSVLASLSALVTFLLCLLMIDFMLSIQL